jgi:polyisoprenoid-binding protein YceI
MTLGFVVVMAAPTLAATWTIDNAKSKLGFSGTQTGTPFAGAFKTWAAQIEFDPSKPEAAHVVVSIDVASASTGDTQRDESMPQPDWFNAGEFAKASFEAKGFVPKGGSDYETTGTLTLRGVSKVVTLPFSLKIDGESAHATGSTTLVRTDFGVGQGSWSDGAMVGLEVAVDIDLVARRQ